jgi:hypothetical protein
MTLQQTSSSGKTEMLMNIAVTLGNYTQSMAHCREIPEVLREALDIDRVCLAVARQPANQADPEFIIEESSGGATGDEAARLLRHYLLPVWREVTSLFESNRSPFQVLRPHSVDESTPADPEMAKSSAIVFARHFDPAHVMLLILDPGDRPSDQLSGDSDEFLLVAHELFNQLHCMLDRQFMPGAVGKPFDTLNQKEWVAVEGLASDASEKQLAVDLDQSPHSLHSHIKAIYHKVGVQGRLSLLLRLNSAQRQRRIDVHSLNRHDARQPARTEPLDHSISVGYAMFPQPS